MVEMPMKLMHNLGKAGFTVCAATTMPPAMPPMPVMRKKEIKAEEYGTSIDWASYDTPSA